MARKPSVRFTVVDPMTKRHCGVFRVWAKKNDVYLAPEDSSGTYKVSLHAGAYQIAFTGEHWSTGQAPNNAPGPGRVVRRYEPSVPVDGVAFAWRLLFQMDALLEAGPLDDDVLHLHPESPDSVLEVRVWLCDASVTDTPPQPIGTDLPLADGRVAKLSCELWHAQHAEPPRRDYVGSMFEFLDRERPEEAPGLILRPLDIG